MKRNTRFTLIGSALACGAVLPQSSQAGGIELYEIATPDVGLASAGYAARAQDASTVFRNPAGMSLLSGSQFQGGLQLTYGSIGTIPTHCSHGPGPAGGKQTGRDRAADGALFPPLRRSPRPRSLRAINRWRAQAGGAGACVGSPANSET